MGLISATDFTEAKTGGSAPTLATEGVSLEFVKNWRVIVSADSGQTLAGAGTLQAYHYNPTTGWARNPDLDLTISVTASTYRSQVFSDVLVGPPMGRLRYVPSGITLSSGSNVNVRYEMGG